MLKQSFGQQSLDTKVSNKLYKQKDIFEKRKKKLKENLKKRKKNKI